jgi:hypothetical protein
MAHRKFAFRLNHGGEHHLSQSIELRQIAEEASLANRDFV